MHGLVIEIEINIDNKPNSSEQEINNLSIFSIINVFNSIFNKQTVWEADV